MRLSIKLFIILTFNSLICNTCNSGKIENKGSKVEPVNIILILADDMGYSDLGCYGSEISTPNIDLLAEEGLRFSQFYNAARCCPTRASLISGIYPHQAGMGGMVKIKGKASEGAYQGYLSRNAVTIAEVLKQRGYYTAASGKWHVGEKRPNWPTDRGFDNYYGLISGAANYFDISRSKKEGVVRHFASDSIKILPSEDNFYMTDAITENAIRFLKTAEEKDQPFFLYLPYTAPHWPLHALQEDIDLYLGKYMEGWDELRQKRYERMVGMGLIEKNWCLSERDPKVPGWNSLSEEQKEKSDLLMAIFAAQIHRLDQGIGELMKQLEEMGKADNTIVFFLADNGASEEYNVLGSDFWGNFWDGNARPGSGDSYHSYGAAWANLSNTPFRQYKRRIHEGGISTPFIVKWPNHIKETGSIVHQPAHIIDIMSTICDITNAEYPKTFNNNVITPMQGQSLAPIFRGEDLAPAEALYWEHEGNKAVRKGDWKLVAMKEQPWELYNLVVDRTEMNNLINNQTEIASDLQRLYEEWAIKVGVK